MDKAPSLNRSATPSSGLPLLGRERELAEIRDGLSATIDGESRVLFLVGEPGIGKTRLAEELTREAAAAGARVLWGTCYEWDGAPAYWPWIQLIRRYADTRDAASLLSDLGPGGGDIAQIVPVLRERLPDLPVPPPCEPDVARFRLFEAIAALLRSATVRQPLVLVLDDLHWADTPSILLLAFLALELRDTRFLLIGTYRDVEVGRDHPLAQPLADIQRAPRCRRLTLSGLTERDVGRFVALSAGDDPSPKLVAAVYRETEGNPFFVTEVVRLLADKGMLAAIGQNDSQPIGLPPTIRETIRQRLRRLSPAPLRMLTIAAVAGREFGLPVLSRVADLPPDVVADDISAAVDARLIYNTDTPDVYRFTHALVQETVAAELTPGQRARLHRHVGEAIEQIHAANLNAHVAELAHHFGQAAIAGEADRAIAYAVKAAEQAMAQVAFESAVEHYQRALRLLDFAPVADDATRCNLLLMLGAAQWDAGDADAGRATYREAAGIARDKGMASQLATAALGYSGGDVVAMVFDDEGTVNLLKEALNALGDGDDRQRAMLLSRLAILLFAGADLAERKREFAQEAVAIGRRLGDDATLLYALDALWVSILGPDTLHARLEIDEETIRLSEAADDRRWIMWSRQNQLNDLLELGDLREADSDLAIFTRLADELRMPIQQFYALTYRVMRALMDGRFAEAEGLIDDALKLGRTAFPGGVEEWITQYLFLLRREQGRQSELEATVAVLASRAPSGYEQYWRACSAVLDCETGRRDRAQGILTSMGADGFAHLRRDASWLATVALLGEVAAILGDEQSGAVLYDLLRPHADRNATVTIRHLWHGPVSYYLGRLAAAASQWHDAEQHLATARSMCTRMNARPMTARTDVAQAALLRRRGDTGDRTSFRDVADRARALVDDLGMTLLATELLELEVQMPGNSMQSKSGVLTPRELDVLRLIADGLPDREIAQALYISPRTVGTHVTSILTKLDLPSRSAAAAYAVRRGLV